MLITIDGKNGQGKSTSGALLAERLGIDFFSTGLLIRYLAYNYRKLSNDGFSKNDIFKRLYKMISIETIAFLKDRDNVDLYNLQLAEYFGVITSDKKMLSIVDDALREYSKNTDVVYDGRNLFEIFPEADYKFYFQSSDTRRREVLQTANNISQEKALNKLKLRDSQERQFDIPYSELIVIDPFSYPLEKVIEIMYEIIISGEKKNG